MRLLTLLKGLFSSTKVAFIFFANACLKSEHIRMSTG